MKIQLFFLFVLLLTSTNIRAQQEHGNTNFSDVVLEGKIIDSIMANRPNEKRKIKIMISKYPFTLIYSSRTSHILYEIEASYNSGFKLTITSPSDRFYMNIAYHTGLGKGWSSQDNIYMLDNGDRISCKLSDNYFEFSGKGSEKLNCQSALYKLKYKPLNLDLNLKTQKKLGQYAELTYKKRDSVLQLQQILLEKYKTIINADLIKTMVANFIGLKYWAWLSDARFMDSNSPYGDEYNAFINSRAYKNINNMLIPKMDEENISSSYTYAECLFYKILVDRIIHYENKVSRRSDEYLESVFETIKKRSPGIVRDKLFTLFILNYKNSVYLKNYLNRSIQLVKAPLYKEILIEIKSQNIVDSPFFSFELEDTEGKITRLKDFNDKVVLIDFWFTGCGPCIILKKAMEPIYEKYKDNPKIAFITISSDRDKQLWLKSVKSGLYADSAGINLFTGGLGQNHPLYKHHNIVGAPHMYLVKNGKIYSSNLPRPSQINEENTKLFSELIEKALSHEPKVSN